jgi:hypothetical protein
MLKTALAALFALGVGYALHALAQPRPDFRQSVMPMGNSSSDGVAFAWFYDPADRTVHVCRTGRGAADPLDCKAKTTLP